jgi:Flp pilus assembly protein TadB
MVSPPAGRRRLMEQTKQGIEGKLKWAIAVLILIGAIVLIVLCVVNVITFTVMLAVSVIWIGACLAVWFVLVPSQGMRKLAFAGLRMEQNRRYKK